MATLVNDYGTDYSNDNAYDVWYVDKTYTCKGGCIDHDGYNFTTKYPIPDDEADMDIEYLKDRYGRHCRFEDREWATLEEILDWADLKTPVTEDMDYKDHASDLYDKIYFASFEAANYFPDPLAAPRSFWEQWHKNIKNKTVVKLDWEY
jgi:hypothetical protein